MNITLFFSFKVKLPPGSRENIMNDLSAMINRNDSPIYKLFEEGKVQEFTQEINAKMSVVNLFAKENGTEENRKLRQEVFNSISNLSFPHILPSYTLVDLTLTGG